jgi:hypothetical protein
LVFHKFIAEVVRSKLTLRRCPFLHRRESHCRHRRRHCIRQRHCPQRAIAAPVAIAAATAVANAVVIALTAAIAATVVTAASVTDVNVTAAANITTAIIAVPLPSPLQSPPIALTDVVANATALT